MIEGQTEWIQTTTWFESLFSPSIIHLHSKSFCASFTNGDENKKEEWRWRMGRGEKETPAHKPHNSKNFVCGPTNTAFGAVLVVLINEWPILKPNQVGFVYMRQDEKCFGLSVQRLIRSYLQASLALSLFQPFKLKWNIGDREVETDEDYFIGNDNVQIWLKNWTVCWRYIFKQNYHINKWMNTTYCKANKGSLQESC